jgi:hypothetical protein
LVLTGELLVLAPGLKMFGEDPTVDGLIRRRDLSCDRKQNTIARACACNVHRARTGALCPRLPTFRR